MKKIIILLSVGFLSSMASAEMPSYTCGKGEIEKIAKFDPGYFSARQLNEEELEIMEIMIDQRYDCNEGVEILDTVKKANKVYTRAKCSVDSLGTKIVNFPLDCEETYLN